MKSATIGESSHDISRKTLEFRLGAMKCFEKSYPQKNWIFWHGTSFSGSSSSSKSAGTKQPGKQQIDLDGFVKPSGYVEFLKFPRDILLMEEIPKQPPVIYETL